MKKNFLKLISSFLLAGLIITGCQKEKTALNEEIDGQSTAARSEKAGGCRMTVYDYYDGIGDYHSIDYFSYKNGLVDEWLTFYGSLFKMEYDSKRKLTISRVYDGETLSYTIHFIYEKDKVVKEIWYDGNTQQVADEVSYFYNQKGEMIRNQSIAYDNYVLYTYTKQGYLESWFYHEGGLPLTKAEYTYHDPNKNPYEAKPGIEYSFPYSNAAFLAGKRWYSSEKITVYDEGGNSFVYYDLDPLQTTWQSGSQNYPLRANYVDILSGASIINTFEYENCSRDNNNNAAGKSLRQKTSMKNKNTPGVNFKSLMGSPKKEAIQKLKAQRKLKAGN